MILTKPPRLRQGQGREGQTQSMSSSSALPATFNKIYQQLCNSSKAQKNKLALIIFSSFSVELPPTHYTQITGAKKSTLNLFCRLSLSS